MLRERENVVQSWLGQRQAEVRFQIDRAVLFGCGQYFFITLQAGALAWMIDKLVMAGYFGAQLAPGLLVLLIAVLGRGFCARMRELYGQQAGQQVRHTLRSELLATIDQLGPSILAQRPTGSWLTLLMEQVDKLNGYYAHYVPQMRLVRIVPLATIVLALCFSWVIALVLLCTAPLLILFMILVGNRAAAASQRNIQALNRLSAHFLDRLQGLSTLRLFSQSQRERAAVAAASDDFRRKTMQVLRLAFLSSTVLEFFTAVSIAITAVYLGMSYLGYLNFGFWENGSPGLFTGLFLLLLAPEYYQPLRELGSFYHAKADAVAAADDLEAFLSEDRQIIHRGHRQMLSQPAASIAFNNVSVITKSGRRILKNLSFTLAAGEQLVVVGESGAGKTTVLNVLLGFVDYEGEVIINGISLRDLDPDSWRQQLSWLGQNPRLFHGTLRDNIALASPGASNEQLQKLMAIARVDEFFQQLPDGLDTLLGDEGAGLSVGQAQRVALARALLRPFQLMLLDEPTASLDQASANMVRDTLAQETAGRTVITITHRPESLSDQAQVLVLEKGQQVAMGDPETLSQTCPQFQQLMRQWQQIAAMEGGMANAQF